MRKDSSSRLSSFAAAIGWRHKKLAVVPPPPVSNPASSTRSRVDSIEPRTPKDDHRHSLLTLSDADPFAVRPITLDAFADPKADLNRVSYASSSSNSNYHALDVPESRELHSTRSMGNLPLRRSAPPPSLTVPPLSPHTSKHCSTPPRPKIRARCLTDSGGSHNALFLVDHPSSPPPPSPRVIIRQPSASFSKSASSQSSSRPSASVTRTASTSSSSVSLIHDAFPFPPLFHSPTPLSQNTRDEPEFTRVKPAPPRPLKKPPSQQSLSRLLYTTPQPPPEPPTDKPRSVHRPRLPIPSLSTRSSSASASTASDSGNPDQRRSTPGKKLFSSSSSYHHPPTFDDDKHSLFSFRSDNLSLRNQTAANSFWEEGSSHDHIQTTAVRVIPDYTPQAIMSKADLAKIEASVEISQNMSSRRSRGYSRSSALTSDIPIGLSPPPPTSRPTKQNTQRFSSKSHTPVSEVRFPQPAEPRPRSQPGMAKLNFSGDLLYTSPLPLDSPPIIGLPPPPRRTRPVLHSQPDLPRGMSPSSRVSSTPTRTKSTTKAMKRASIMRKPSFLDIDDDTDQETESEHFDQRLNGSFLDFARESFDTVRSDD